MNAQAAALGASGNFIFVGDPVTLFPVAPSFITYTPGQFLRPFDARNLGNEGDSGN
jgi:hypothetical protein